MPEPPPEHVQRLGSIAINGQAFELEITKLLAKTLTGGTFPVATRIARALGVSRTLDLIRDSSDTPAVQAWLPTARKAVTARNRAIHTSWFVDDESGETGVLSKERDRHRSSPA